MTETTAALVKPKFKKARAARLPDIRANVRVQLILMVDGKYKAGNLSFSTTVADATVSEVRDVITQALFGEVTP